jgi:hypothetical protein
MERFGYSLTSDEDWLLTDITLLSKRMIDHLRTLQCTYNITNLIKACSDFMYFIWKDLPCAQKIVSDPLFESTMFHILNVLRFTIFNVESEELNG